MKIQDTPSKTLTGHSQLIYQAILLPNNLLVSCSEDETIKVWDTTSGEDLFTLKAHTDRVYSLAILPNGWLTSGSRDKTIKVWNLQDKKEVRELRGHKDTVI